MSARSNSEEGDGGEYRAIKRIRQACGNCRRKKVRCSGERPVCSFCNRLSQSCCYNDEPPARRPELPPNPKPNQDDLFHRVSTLETQLKELAQHVNSSDKNDPSEQSWSPAENGTSVQAGPAQEASPLQHPGTSNPGKFQAPPPPQILALVIDDYFSYVHGEPYTLFHERTFRERLKRDEVPEYLLFAVLASGVRYSSSSFFEGHRTTAVEEYSNWSWLLVIKRWNSIDEEHDIDIVRAILLLSAIDFTGGRRHRAWIKIGLTIRISQDLALMDEPDARLDPIEKEERRRLLWSTYMMDKFVSCNRNRPPGILDDDCTVHLPCHDSKFEAGEDTICPALHEVDTAVEFDLSPFAFAVCMSSLLARTARYALSGRYRAPKAPPWDPTSDFASISSKLAFYESHFRIGDPLHSAAILGIQAQSQPTAKRNAGHLILANALWHICQCLLNHPFLLLRRPNVINGTGHGKRNFLRRAFEAATEHTVALSELLRDVEAAGCVLRASIYSYCALISSTLHVLNLHLRNEYQRTKATELLRVNKRVLESLSTHWKSAGTMLASLQNFENDSLQYSHLLDADSDPKIEPLHISGLDELLDYDTLSTKVLDPKPSVEASFDSAPNLALTGMAWMDFDTGNIDLFSYPTPSDHQSNGILGVDNGASVNGETRGSSDNPASEMSPLSLFLMGAGS